MLRAPTNDHTLILKYGPHGGGHGHYDKLGFVSYARGGILAVDPGTQPYGAPTHDTWDKMTVAHNTMVVDERTQAEATGQLMWSQFEPGFSAARAEAGPVYRGVRLDRTMLLTADYALDVFVGEATDSAEHQDGRVDPPVRNFSVELQQGPAEQGTTVVTGNGLGQDLQKPVAYVMARRRGQRARFVTLLAPYGEAESIRGFRQVDPWTVAVSGAGWEDTIVFGESGVRCTRQPPAIAPK